MITGSNTLVKVRRRSGPNLSMASASPPTALNGAGVAAQILLAKLASMEQRLNSLVPTQPAPIRRSSTAATNNFPTASDEIDPEELQDMFD